MAHRPSVRLLRPSLLHDLYVVEVARKPAERLSKPQSNIGKRKKKYGIYVVYVLLVVLPFLGLVSDVGGFCPGYFSDISSNALISVRE